MFGVHPEHIWLIYIVQSFFFLPCKFISNWKARPLNQALYYLDFCWMMNFSGVFFILLLLLEGFFPETGLVSAMAREAIFNAFMGVCCGTLMGANIALPFVACRKSVSHVLCE